MIEDPRMKRGKKKQGRHPERALSAAFVRTVTEPGRYLDGQGLNLLVTKTGGRCWIQRLTIGGRRRELGLGGYPVVTLAQARDQALANKRLVREGGDPLAEKRKARVPTFAEATTEVLKHHRPSWRNPKHAHAMGNDAPSVRLSASGSPTRAYHHHSGRPGGSHAYLARKSANGPPDPATHRSGDEMGHRPWLSRR